MEDPSLWLIIPIVICVSLSAFFSATETAFSTMSRAKVKGMVQNGNKKAKTALRLFENYDELISTILIGNNIVNIATATLATLLFVELFASSGATISTVVTTVVVLIFGEVTPKSIAKEVPEKFATAVAPIFSFLNIVFKPINFLLVKIKKATSVIFGIKGERGIESSELINIVEEAKITGGIDNDESELIKNAIEFNDVEVSDILTPRVDIVCASDCVQEEELAGLFKLHGYSRIPIYKETIDNIIGFVSTKDFYNSAERGNFDINSMLTPAVIIPPQTSVFSLLKILQQRKVHLAVVVDEFGGTEGIVTLEDIIEELVGEIWDESDNISAEITQISENSYIVPMPFETKEFFEKFKISRSEDISTINGWIVESMGKVPCVGDIFDCDNITVEITKTEKRRVTEIKITVNC